MKVAVDLKAMSVPEKMELIQAVWDDLLNSGSEPESPNWRGELLRRREERVKNGRESFVDWESAKAEMRKGCSSRFYIPP